MKSDEYKRLQPVCKCKCYPHCGFACMTDGCNCEECECSDCQDKHIIKSSN